MTQQDLQGIASQIVPGAQVRDPGTFASWLEEQSVRFQQVAMPRQSGAGAQALAAQPQAVNPGPARPAPTPEEIAIYEQAVQSGQPQGFPLGRIRDAGLNALGSGGQLLASLAVRAGVGPDEARRIIDQKIAAGQDPEANAFQRFINQAGGGFFGFDEARGAFPQVGIPQWLISGPEHRQGGGITLPQETAFHAGGAEALETVVDPANAFDVGPISRLALRGAQAGGRRALRAGERAAQAVGEANVGNVLMPAAREPRAAGMAASRGEFDELEELRQREYEIAALLDEGAQTTLMPGDRPSWSVGHTDDELIAFARDMGVDPRHFDSYVDLPPEDIQAFREGRYSQPNVKNRSQLKRELPRIRQRIRELEASRGPGGRSVERDPRTGDVVEIEELDWGPSAPVAVAPPPASTADAAPVRRAFRTDLTPEEVAEVNAERAQRAGMDAASFAALTPDEQAEVLAGAGGRRPPPQQPPAAGAGGTPPVDPTQGVVDRLVAGIRSAKPVREETEAAKSAALSRRVAVAAREFEQGDPLTASQRSGRYLGGELPSAQFEPQRDAFTPDDLRLLYGKIQNSSLRFFDRKNTADALTKLLSGQIPQREEIAKLERMFGPELAREILGKRPLGERIRENVLDALQIPKTLRSTLDLSAPLRQGITLAPGHPREFRDSFTTMLKALASEEAALDVDAAIRADPLFGTLVGDAGKRIYIGDITKSGALGINAREEMIASRLAEKLPGVRQSNRAYTTFLNKFRFDVAKSIYNQWVADGVEITPSRLDLMTRFINRATGRGGLGRFEGAAEILNVAFWSPRFVVSRFQTPLSLVTTDPVILKLVAKDLAKFYGTGATILSLLALSGMAAVELDPRSSDFGKVRVGDTRYDFWGGFQPIARYTAQFITKQKKDTDTGEISRIGASNPRLYVGWRFIRSKLAPGLPALAGNEVDERTFIGNKLTDRTRLLAFGPEVSERESQIAEQVVPLFNMQLAEAIKDEGLTGGAMVAPGFLGVGTELHDEEEAATR